MPKLKNNEDEIMLTSAQICEHFKMSDYDRYFVNKKYKNESHTLEEWESIFKKEKLFY